MSRQGSVIFCNNRCKLPGDVGRPVKRRLGSAGLGNGPDRLQVSQSGKSHASQFESGAGVNVTSPHLSRPHCTALDFFPSNNDRPRCPTRQCPPSRRPRGSPTRSGPSPRPGTPSACCPRCPLVRKQRRRRRTASSSSTRASTRLPGRTRPWPRRLCGRPAPARGWCSCWR